MNKRTIVCFRILLLLSLLYPTNNYALQGPILDKKVKNPALLKTGEYIDLNSSTVKFLFKTNFGAKVQFFLGENQNTLCLVKTVEKYDCSEGINIENLIPNKVYYYQVRSWFDGRQLVSPVFHFTKSPPENLNIVAEWARKSIFYEVFIRSFADGNTDGIGDFKGLTAKIGYLKELGIDAIWLMPHFKSNLYHGYDVVDFYKVEPDYGTMRDFQSFLQTAHENNIKVIIDLVINHSSNQNSWFIQAASGPDNPYRNYYVWGDQFDVTNRKPWYATNSGYYLGIFESRMPDLNFRNYQLRAEIKKLAQFWLDPNNDGDFSDGVDGFRLDATLHIDINQEVNHAALREFNSYVKSINPDAFIVGEEWADFKTIAPYYKDFESSFNFEINQYIFQMVKGRNVDIIKILNQIYGEYQKYSSDFIDSTLLSNHDQERIASVFHGDLKSQKLAAAILLTLPGTPFIYYGEELGQKGSWPHPNIREAFDWYESATGPMMTDSKLFLNHIPRNTRRYDGISVEAEINDPNSLLNYYKKLIFIRKEYPLFFTGKYTKTETPVGTYGYRIDGNETYYLEVIHNIGSNTVAIDFTDSSSLILVRKIIDRKIELSPCETVILKYKK
jgi:alpha-amylase